MTEISETAFPLTWPAAYPRHAAIDTARARSLDAAASAEFGLPGLVLMEHAARGVAEVAAHLAPGSGEIVVCCGPGNNGGDGYGAARFLRGWGRAVSVLRMSPRPPPGANAGQEYAWAGAEGAIEGLWEAPERLEALLARGPALLVDALFGVGLVRPLSAPYATWIEALNASGIPILSIDIPSGMHTDTGLCQPVAVRASVTASMAAPKRGFQPGAPGAACAGHVIELDIGLPRRLLRDLER